MRGSHRFTVSGKRAVYEYTIRRNITVIKGDSATGKTTLLHMLYEYLRVGRASGFSVATSAPYYVYLRREVGRSWEDALYPLRDTIIFIEENNNFVFSLDFAKFVKDSGNYFVIVNHAPLRMLPYSVHEIYEIVSTRKMRGVYHEFQELYANFPYCEHNRIDRVITEDSNAVFDFMQHVYCHSAVVSARGNGNIQALVETAPRQDTLVIADGAAFGAFVEDVIAAIHARLDARITLWVPESFAYLILCAGLLEQDTLQDILRAPSDYIDCQEYESWEQFFEQLLVDYTAHTDHPYNKDRLHAYYLQEAPVRAICAQMPKELQATGERP